MMCQVIVDIGQCEKLQRLRVIPKLRKNAEPAMRNYFLADYGRATHGQRRLSWRGIGGDGLALLFLQRRGEQHMGDAGRPGGVEMNWPYHSCREGAGNTWATRAELAG